MILSVFEVRLTATLAGALLTSIAAAGCAPTDDETLSEAEVGEIHQSATLAHTPAAFSMPNSYYGTSSFGGSCSAFAAQDMLGHEPTAAGRYPVAVWLTGTLADFAGEGAQEFTKSMASLGFVAATVEYTNYNYASCGTLKTRASCVFNASSANSAIAKLCARSKADCSKGIVVAGIRQGATMASLAKSDDSAVEQVAR